VAELAAMGWHATVRNTGWAFIYGSATRAKEDNDSGFDPAPPR
jgi:hypothetical protein